MAAEAMPADKTPVVLWAPLAWLPGGWRANVLLRAGSDGRWTEVTAGVALAPPGASVVAGPLLPGVVDAHSHAFQRAFAGLANNTFVFCLPGSTSACRTAWEKLIRSQLDATTRPCNLAGLMPRLREI
jgi:cytosine/adenosine deaminase-related metal-dependent hydrolase